MVATYRWAPGAVRLPLDDESDLVHARLGDRRPPPAGITARPIRPGDKSALRELFESLSEQSRLHRFLHPKKMLSARELAYFTEIDHRSHEALVALTPAGRLVAVARYAAVTADPTTAHIACTVHDAWQARGIARSLASPLIEHARRSGFVRLQAMTLADNHPARKLLRRLGFTVYDVDGAVLHLELTTLRVAAADHSA
jgi:RimJ/RimL family protein N-acetyltransferase